jgi:Zn-finger domain-containing protein
LWEKERINFGALSEESRAAIEKIKEAIKREVPSNARIRFLPYLPVNYETEYLIISIDVPVINETPRVFWESKEADIVLNKYRKILNDNAKLQREVKEILRRLLELDQEYEKILAQLYGDRYSYSLEQRKDKVLAQIRQLRG